MKTMTNCAHVSKQQHHSRASNRSAGLISSRFPGVSRRHFDKNSVEFEVFETVNFNLDKEACGDRPHPTPVSSNHH